MAAAQKDVCFIQTGGTIDKDYPKVMLGYAFEFGEPAMARVLERLNPAFSYDVIPLLQKDSTEITTEDRECIKQAALASPAKWVIVTHGTDTMIESALHVGTLSGKTVIFTGALRPERFRNSDADVNIGVALGAVQCLPPGSYVAMSGNVYAADGVDHNPETGQFQHKDSAPAK